MATLNGDNGQQREPTSLLSLRISTGAFIGLLVQTVGVIYWISTMHADVQYLKREYAMLAQRADTLDTNGTRALVLAQQRISDLIAANNSQDIRLRELDTKISELQRNIIENKFWIDQMVQFIRQYTHPNIVPRAPGSNPPP